MDLPDHATCYAAVTRRDARFDGRFTTAVATTGVFCRPSCPARTPKEANVRFYPHAATAIQAGFRPCRLCRPELAPGHSDWNRRADLTGRAITLIDEGAIDRAGVSGLAEMLGVSDRHLGRELRATLGTGPLQLARARRLLLARLLVDQTDVPMADVAFAAGFGSVRQFNDTISATFDATPTELRRRERNPPAPAGRAVAGGVLTLRLPSRGPVSWGPLNDFFAMRAIPGLETATATGLRRNVPGGWIELDGPDPAVDGPSGHHLQVRCSLSRLETLAELVPTIRRVADLDTDLAPIAAHLANDPILADRLSEAPISRLPGAFDRFEVAVRAIVGQQISVAGARTLLGRLLSIVGASAHPTGDEAPARPGRSPTPPTSGEADAGRPAGGPTPPTSGEADAGGAGGAVAEPAFERFPAPAQVAEADLDRLGMPGRRRATIRAMAEALAEGSVVLGPHSDPAETRSRLAELPGIGPWTAGYITMRALGDPDGWPPNDLGLRRSLGVTDAELEARAERWRPWRAYAALLLWRTDPTASPADGPTKTEKIKTKTETTETEEASP